MKKILLLMMCCPAMLAAQNGNGVTVSNLAVHAGTVTFNVGWNDNQPEGFLWSDSVWVFVDYNKNGVMTRLPVTDATVSAGVVEKIFGNDKGVWVIGNARAEGSFSATVQLLTDITDVAGACAYASNYPPVGEYETPTQIKFTGTPMYNIVLKHESGATITRRADSPFSVPASYTAQSFTDVTGAPGAIFAVKVSTPTYAASTQTWTVSGTAGTQTWSAYINLPACDKDTYSASASVADCRNSSGTYPFLYSGVFVQNNASTLCDNGWRVPTSDDLCVLDRLMNNDANACKQKRNGASIPNYISLWGGQLTPFSWSTSYDASLTKIHMWSQTVCGGEVLESLRLTTDTLIEIYCQYTFFGFPVRCVRE